MIPKRPFIHSGNKYYHLPHQVRDKKYGENHSGKLTRSLFPVRNPPFSLLTSYKGLAVPSFLPLTDLINYTGVWSLLLPFTSCRPYSTGTMI